MNSATNLISHTLKSLRAPLIELYKQRKVMKTPNHPILKAQQIDLIVNSLKDFPIYCSYKLESVVESESPEGTNLVFNLKYRCTIHPSYTLTLVFDPIPPSIYFLHSGELLL